MNSNLQIKFYSH